MSLPKCMSTTLTLMWKLWKLLIAFDLWPFNWTDFGIVLTYQSNCLRVVHTHAAKDIPDVPIWAFITQLVSRQNRFKNFNFLFLQVVTWYSWHLQRAGVEHLRVPLGSRRSAPLCCKQIFKPLCNFRFNSTLIQEAPCILPASHSEANVPALQWGREGRWKQNGVIF